MSAARIIRVIGYEEIRMHPVLLEEYAEECSIPVLGRPNPQWEMYAALQESGALVLFGVYAYTQLVGFAAVLVQVLPHYGVPAAVVESLFVAKKYRAGGYGAMLMAEIEEYARDAWGCVAILYSAPADSQLETVLGLAKSYARTHSIFCKPLRERAGDSGEDPRGGAGGAGGEAG